MKPLLIDMEMGNLESIREAFRRLGHKLDLVTSPSQIHTAGLVILPGVGSFADGMKSLTNMGYVEPLIERARAQGPMLGICLGMQLLADHGDEHGPTDGLGIVPGRVIRLAPESREIRVPNMGWCDVKFMPEKRISSKNGAESVFYFAHSFYLACDDAADIAGVIDFDGREVPVAVERGGVLGLQFHPEKSQDAGMDLLAGYLGSIK